MTQDGLVEFTLLDGYTDAQGCRHDRGFLGPAAVHDEILALLDFRVHLRPESFLSVLLGRSIRGLGGLPRVDAGVIDRLSERDRLLLERLYRRVNAYPDIPGED